MKVDNKLLKERVNIIRAKKNYSNLFNMEVLEEKQNGFIGYKLSFYDEPNYELKEAVLYLVDGGFLYTKRTLLLYLFGGLKHLQELCSKEEKSPEEMETIEELRDMEGLIEYLFDEEVDNLYYLYADNPDVGVLYEDW